MGGVNNPGSNGSDSPVLSLKVLDEEKFAQFFNKHGALLKKHSEYLEKNLDASRISSDHIAKMASMVDMHNLLAHDIGENSHHLSESMHEHRKDLSSHYEALMKHLEHRDDSNKLMNDVKNSLEERKLKDGKFTEELGQLSRDLNFHKGNTAKLHTSLQLHSNTMTEANKTNSENSRKVDENSKKLDTLTKYIADLKVNLDDHTKASAKTSEDMHDYSTEIGKTYSDLINRHHEAVNECHRLVAKHSELSNKFDKLLTKHDEVLKKNEELYHKLAEQPKPSTPQPKQTNEAQDSQQLEKMWHARY